MRYGLLVLALAVGLGLSQGWFSQGYERMTSAALSDDARLAIDVRCQDREARASQECRATLKKLYLAGTLDPDKTLRTYCDSVKNAYWGGSRPTPPAVCVERYGGWQRS